MKDRRYIHPRGPWPYRETPSPGLWWFLKTHTVLPLFHLLLAFWNFLPDLWLLVGISPWAPKPNKLLFLNPTVVTTVVQLEGQR